MFGQVIRKVFGTKQDRDLKLLQPLVDEINALESSMQEKSDQELKNQTDKFKKLIQDFIQVMFLMYLTDGK